MVGENGRRLAPARLGYSSVLGSPGMGWTPGVRGRMGRMSLSRSLVSLSVQGLTEKVHADTFRCSPDALASEA